MKPETIKDSVMSYNDDVRPCFPDKVGAEASNPAWDMSRDVRRTHY
jgi:hypothetical protein